MFEDELITNYWIIDFDPVALQLGPLAIRWYALAYIGGILIGWYIMRQLSGRKSLWGKTKIPKPLDCDDLMVASALGIVLGGRLGYVLFYNLPYYIENPSKILATWDGGMSFHGGFLGVFLCVSYFAYKRKLNPLALFDLIAVTAPIGLFFGRISNFINGELWGRISYNSPFSVLFPGAGMEPRHPSQLYEAFSEGFLLFCVMLWAVQKFGFKRPGTLIGIFSIGYGFSRIICEFFRQPDIELGFLFGGSFDFLGGGITMGMLLSFPIIFLGSLLVFAAKRDKTHSIFNG